ncbi:MAG: putative selenium-dependent hydroxylase accessory protein YqeC [Anaerolineae bacterium]|nr:putative selenium-dependent hydroxylase accessory protein YqeC [Anaerolineae bacterium]
MRLREALRVRRGDVVAFVGAGGKTSALFRLASELRAEGWRVLATTTTHIARHEVDLAPFAAPLAANVTHETVRQWLNEHGFVFLYGALDPMHDRVLGLHPDLIAGLVDSVNSDVLLIEADGARRLPLKAPYEHEPVIPPDASLVVPVAGIDALGRPLDDEHVYNAARVQERYGFPDGAELIPPWMALTIRDPELGLRGVPESARVVALVNKVPDTAYERRRARRVADLILRSERVEAVALGAVQAAGDDPVLERQRRVAAVVLAAGTSSRMGQSKALLPWDGRTVIEAIVNRLVTARVSEIVVVTGHRADRVSAVLHKQPVRTCYNPDFAQGEMLSSLQAGLRALPDSTAACLVVMGDQPMLDGRVVTRVMTAYAGGQGDIVIPTHRKQRGHPVLIDRRFWPELLALEHGAPRDVIQQYPDQTGLVEVDTDTILRDIDTPEEYRRARFLAGLR